MSDEGGAGGEDIEIPGLVDAKFIGRGGAAVVYRATQTSLQRTVAVKLLTSAWDESVARRFDREQRAMGRLSNQPGIVPVYESGVNASGVPYIVMPYYANGSLKDYSEREGPISWEQAANLLLAIAEAVGRAHDVGIVHRDLKPANILLSGTGRPLVADFGIARLASDGTGIATTAVAFTPAYCPPEVLDESEPAPEADTYALAATFWALVRGKPPFTDSHTVLGMEAVLKRVLTEPPAHLDEIPSPVASFIDRAMSKEPEDRPPNGQAFADQLREAVEATKPVGSAWTSSTPDDATFIRQAPESRTMLAAPSAQNRRKLIGSSAAVILVTALIGLIAVWRPWLDSSTPEPFADADATASNTVFISSGDTMQLLPLSADASSAASEEARRSAELAIVDIGVVQGVEVEILQTLEVACDGGLSEVVETTIGETQASILIGTTCAASARSVMEAAEQRDMSWISFGLRLPTLTATAEGAEGADHVDGFFRVAQNDQFQGTVAAQYATQELGAESAVIVRGDFAGASEIADAFASAFGRPSEVTTIEVTDPSNLSEAVDEWDATEPEVTFWILDAEAATAFASATANGTNRSVPRLAIGDALTPSSATNRFMEGTLVVVPQVPVGTATAATGRSLNELVEAYESMFGEPPKDLLAFASGYDAAALALEVLRSTAVASEEGLTIDRRALRVNLESAASDGLTGAIACDFLGDCGSQALAVVEIDGISEDSTLENVVKLFAKEP